MCVLIATNIPSKYTKIINQQRFVTFYYTYSADNAVVACLFVRLLCSGIVSKRLNIIIVKIQRLVVTPFQLYHNKLKARSTAPKSLCINKFYKSHTIWRQYRIRGAIEAVLEGRIVIGKTVTFLSRVHIQSYMQTRYCHSNSVRVSVRPSVCL